MTRTLFVAKRNAAAMLLVGALLCVACARNAPNASEVVPGGSTAPSTRAEATAVRAEATTPSGSNAPGIVPGSPAVALPSPAPLGASQVALRASPLAIKAYGAMAFDRSTGRLYVAERGWKRINDGDSFVISVYDPALAYLGAMPLATTNSFLLSTYAAPERIVVNDRTHKIYVLTSGSVVVVDAITLRQLAIIAGGGTDIALNAVANKVYVASAKGVAVIDGVTDQVAATVPVPDPSAIAIDEKAGVGYSIQEGRGITVFDTSTNKLIRRIEFPAPILFTQTPSVAVDGEAHRLFAWDTTLGATAVFNTETYQRLPDLPGTKGHGLLTLDPDRHVLFARPLDHWEREVMVFETLTGRVRPNLALDALPQLLAVEPKSGAAFVGAGLQLWTFGAAAQKGSPAPSGAELISRVRTAMSGQPAVSYAIRDEGTRDGIQVRASLTWQFQSPDRVAYEATDALKLSSFRYVRIGPDQWGWASQLGRWDKGGPSVALPTMDLDVIPNRLGELLSSAALAGPLVECGAQKTCYSLVAFASRPAAAEGLWPRFMTACCLNARILLVVRADTYLPTELRAREYHDDGTIFERTVTFQFGPVRIVPPQ